MLSFRQQLAELTQSKQILESIIAGKISSFAYPYCRYSEDSIAAVKEAAISWPVAPGPAGFEESRFWSGVITISVDSVILEGAAYALQNNQTPNIRYFHFYLRTETHGVILKRSEI